MTSKRTALEQISELLNPLPQHFSDDDDDVDNTKAKLVEGFDEHFSEEETPGRFVKPHVALDDDPRYEGKRASRKKLGYEPRDEPSSDEDDYDDDDAELSGESLPEEETSLSASADADEDESNVNSEVDEEQEESGGEEEESEFDGDEEESEVNGDEEESEVDGDEEESEVDEEGDEGSEVDGDTDHKDKDLKKKSKVNIVASDPSFLHISSKNIASEIEKGKAVRNQLSLWDSLLESRIHMQKCLVASNQLPKPDMMEKFRKKGGENFNLALKENEAGLKNLLDRLLSLQETLVTSFSESKEVLQKAGTLPRVESDEEIPSDTDAEEDAPKESEPASESGPRQKRRRLEDFEDVISSHHQQYSEFRNSVIQKWNERTRVATGKMSSRNFSAFEQTTLQQIQQVLSNKNRLLQRTRLRRAFTSVLGESPVAPPANGEQEKDASQETKTQLEHDPEIFDDSDFYQQLLRELIERRAGDTQDPATLGRRWATLQKLRSKMKRKVDVRATKGRRLRYDPHPKLVGFMAPVEAPSAWSDQAINELHNSLFGGKKS